MMLDDATISKMKVAELKQELEDRQVEIPKGKFWKNYDSRVTEAFKDKFRFTIC